MFKGIAFILVLGLIIFLVIIAIVASFVYRTIHRVKKVLNGETDDYNPEIGKKHQHYTHKSYGRTSRQSSQQQGYNGGQQEAYQGSGREDYSDEHIHQTETGEILFETRNPDQVNRQIFSADEGEYVEFSEES